jgi:hypothetical protein
MAQDPNEPHGYSDDAGGAMGAEQGLAPGEGDPAASFERRRRKFHRQILEVADRLRWTESFASITPMLSTGEQCPWYTYAALHFLSTRDVSGLSVFEYGCGNSTLWWSRHAAKVRSVESNPLWYEKMLPLLPENAAIILRELANGETYADEILKFEPFDVIVIDGFDRVKCAEAAVQRLNDQTVVIWDNSDRRRYLPGFKLLRNHGFRQLDFFGFGPTNVEPWMTSVFYRSGNCLGI